MTRPPVGYKLMLSLHDDEVRRLKELAKAIPDVREEKVRSIKKRIESGKYRVPAESVAESMVNLRYTLMSDRSLRLWRIMRRH